MAIVTSGTLTLNPETILDLKGSQGNAFFLLGLAKNLADKMGLEPEPILAEMKESDYNNLIKVFDMYFGEIYTLVK